MASAELKNANESTLSLGQNGRHFTGDIVLEKKNYLRFD